MNMKRYTGNCLALILIALLTHTVAVPAAKANGLPFKGSLAGSETDTFTPPNSILANAHLVSSNGDSLFCEGSGQATETGTPGLVMITETYAITGGTGRLAEVTGGFTVVRQVNLITGETSGTFDGNIFLH